MLNKDYNPKEDIQEFFRILDSEEETDSGRVFRPTEISSCRVMHTIKLGEIFTRLREYVRA